MILKKFEDTDFRLVVHDNGFELFGLKADPKHYGDFDFDNPFEYWEDNEEDIDGLDW